MSVIYKGVVADIPQDAIYGEYFLLDNKCDLYKFQKTSTEKKMEKRYHAGEQVGEVKLCAGLKLRREQ